MRNLKVAATKRVSVSVTKRVGVLAVKRVWSVQNGQKTGMKATAIPQKIRFSGTPTFR